jgi:hypothetical protein
MKKQAKKELMWQCKKCKKIGGFRNYHTSREEVNAHTPQCRHCQKITSWEPLVIEVKTFF